MAHTTREGPRLASPAANNPFSASIKYVPASVFAVWRGLSGKEKASLTYVSMPVKPAAMMTRSALCWRALPSTTCMPCASKRNFGLDRDDGLTVATHFGIETREIDLSPVKEAMTAALSGVTELSDMGSANINPRLRMTTLYAVAASENRLVAGTGNRSEAYLGYFTKWGDGAYDFNPIADLTVTEIYAFLRYLGCPECVITKAPSAGLFDGQTDETETGISYAALDRYLLTGVASDEVIATIERMHGASEHKRRSVPTYR